MAGGDFRHPIGQRLAGVQIVEADRHAGRGLGRDHIGGGIAAGDIGDFEVRCLKPVGALVQHMALQLGQQRDQLGQRIVGQMG
jgi:hypothetical protein